ncbi:unnamed protein product [Paramecium sonneborni]|uniref:Uncharacterized protein n=1 Tax=Paramecium sonneborni TaxID=65129 RepID=A0A8S1NKA0_9CILI|nr:unnamed protein product [Paramecium sonneborni]
MKKKIDKRNVKPRDLNLPYNEYIHPARQIQVKLLLSKKPLKDYQVYDADGSIIRKREQVKQLSSIVNAVKSKLQGRVEKKNQKLLLKKNIINQQALFKLKVQKKVITQCDEPYNFEVFPLKQGFKLTFTKKKKKKEEEKVNNEEEDLIDADTINSNNLLENQVIPHTHTLPLFKLPKKKQNLSHEVILQKLPFQNFNFFYQKQFIQLCFYFIEDSLGILSDFTQLSQYQLLDKYSSSFQLSIYYFNIKYKNLSYLQKNDKNINLI